MYPKIDSSSDCHHSIYYNENKVKKETALFLYAANFIKDAHQLTLEDKLQRFDYLNVLNPRSWKNTMHISLNFNLSDNLSTQKMIDIAAAYMEGVGYGQQPYLIYQHLDMVHPHLHIVASNIRPHLTRLRIYKNHSKQVQKDIENRFGLIKEREQTGKRVLDNRPSVIEKLQYGRVRTTNAIAIILDHVLSNYKFVSLSELNDLLRVYNVKADPGKPGSQMRKYKGIAYTALDEKGKGIGGYIKASSFYFKPTLANLEIKFQENKIRREPDLERLRSAIKYALRDRTANWEQFTGELKMEKIRIVLHKIPGQPDEISFIDLKTKTIATGIDLGPGFTALAISDKLALNQSREPKQQQQISKELKKDRGLSL